MVGSCPRGVVTMSRGLAVVRAGLALGLLAGAVVSGIVGVGLFSKSLHGQRTGVLIGGLGLGAVALLAVGVSVWLVLLLIKSGESDSDRAIARSRRIAFSLLILIAEAGAAWLAIEFAGRHRVGPAWITGLLGLAVSGLVFLAWFSGGVDGDEDLVALSVPVVFAEVSLGGLAVMFAAEHHPVAAWTVAGLAILESTCWMVLPESAETHPPLVVSLAAIYAIVMSPFSVLTLLIKFASDGNVIAVVVTGVIALPTLVFLLIWFEIIPEPRLAKRSAAGSYPRRPIPALARLAGLIVPLGTIVWTEVSRAHALNLTTATHVLTAAAWLTLAVVILLGLQGRLIAWLQPRSADYLLDKAAPHPALPEPARPSRSGRSAESYERDGYGPSPSEPFYYGRRRYEPEREEEILRERAVLADYRPGNVVGRLADRLIHPLSLAPSALYAGAALAASTGLNVDRIWPRLELVVPPDVRRAVARDERIVVTLRVAAASAICTALIWPLSAEIILAGVSNGALAALAGAPIALAIAILVIARTRVANLFLRRVAATDVYRFDLVKALRLPLPQDSSDFWQLSRFIRDSFSDRPIVWADESSAAAAPDFGQLREGLARDVAAQTQERIGELLRGHRQQVLRDNEKFLDQQRARFTDWLSSQALGSQELALLADRIAERAAAPVSDGLVQRMADLEENFSLGLRAAVEQVIGESVLGPPLANFTGYLTLELHRSSEENPQVEPSGGTIRTGPGHELKLVMSVVREPAAASVASLGQGPDGSFLVLEPVVIEGGRDVPVAEFEAIADCATLTPLPRRRRTLRVATQEAALFGFKLPDRDSKHELWFQLYQSGRLIQAIAISVEVRPEQVIAR